MSSLFLKKSQKFLDNEGNGEGGIRTHGTRQEFNGFQDRLLKPLGHPSRTVLILTGNRILVKNQKEQYQKDKSKINVGKLENKKILYFLKKSDIIL